MTQDCKKKSGMEIFLFTDIITVKVFPPAAMLNVTGENTCIMKITRLTEGKDWMDMKENEWTA
jgi:hypothetical protein